MLTKYEIINIRKDLIQFRFIENLDRVAYYTSVYALINDTNVLLIDTGYMKYAKQYTEWLDQHNLTVTDIIITHYHKDHAEGCVLFQNANLIASARFKAHFKHLQNSISSHYKLKKPDILINDEYHMKWGNSAITIFPSPGHTQCGLTVIIDQLMFVSDLLLQDLDGKMIIPYVDIHSDPVEHLRSLRKLLSYDNKSLCLTHGNIISEQSAHHFITQRIYYFERFIESNYQAPIELCLIYNKDEYAMKEIHKLNIRNAKKYR